MDFNRSLVSWTSDQTPDEGVTVTLKCAALSMSIEKGGVVFGSLEDGALYVARLVSGGKEWEVQYPSTSNSGEVSLLSSPGTRHHVATFAARRTDHHPEPTSSTTTTLFQIWADVSCLYLLQYNRRRQPSGSAPPGTEYVVTRSIVPHSAGSAKLRWIGRHNTFAVLAYQCGASEVVCLSVNLFQGTLRSTFRLPLSSDPSWHKKIGLLGNILVVLTPSPSAGNNSELQLYDAHQGGLLSKQSLWNVDCDRVLSLLTDSNSRLALVLAGPEAVHIVSSSVVMPSLVSRPISLAQGLMGCVAESSTPTSGVNRSNHEEEEDVVQRAIALLRQSLVEIQQKGAATRREKFLSARFIEATHILTERDGDDNENDRPHRTSISDTAVHMTNPQEPMEKLNGCNGNKKRKISSEPDTASCDHHEIRIQTAIVEPRLLPPLFVDSGIQVAIEILMLEELPESIRNDARKILRQLVRTGLASARSTIPNLSVVLRSLEPTEEDGMNVAYSPVDLVFDVCRYCGDLTEQQMVSTLHYVLTNADAYHLCLYLQRNVKLLGSSYDQATQQLSEWKCLLLQRKNDRHRTEQDDATYSSLFGKMVRAATASLLCKLSSHSECNESLLRNALRQKFSPAELAYVSRVLASLLGSSTPLPPGTSQIRLLQWLTQTTEELVGQSLAPDDRSSDSARLLAQQIVGDEVHKTDSLQLLKGLVDAAVVWERRAVAASHNHHGGGTSKRGGVSKLPLYQIERLFF